MSFSVSYKFDFKPLVKYINDKRTIKKKNNKIPQSFITYFFKNCHSDETLVREFYYMNELDFNEPQNIIDLFIRDEFMWYNGHCAGNIKYYGMDYNTDDLNWSESVRSSVSIFVQHSVMSMIKDMERKFIHKNEKDKNYKLYQKLVMFKTLELWKLYENDKKEKS